MFLFYEVKYSIRTGMRAEFIEKLRELGIGEKSRAERGNRKYEYIIPVDEADTLLLYEIWETASDQQAHTGAAHFKQLTEIKSLYVNNTEIKISRIDETFI